MTTLKSESATTISVRFGRLFLHGLFLFLLTALILSAFRAGFGWAIKFPLARLLFIVGTGLGMLACRAVCRRAPDARRLGWAEATAILAAGLAVRAMWCLLVPTQPVSDFLQYHNLAAGLANFHRFDGLDLRMDYGFFRSYHAGPTAFRMPGYPLMLAVGYALWGVNYWWGYVLNCLFYLVSGTVLCAAIRRDLNRGGAAAVLAAYSFYPDLLYACSLYGTDLAGVALLLSAVGLLLLPRPSLTSVAASGAAFGLAVHCRPYLLPTLPAAAVLALWRGDRWRARRWRAVGVHLLMAALTLVPWAARNYLVMRTPLLTHSSGWHFTMFVNNTGPAWASVEDPSQPALYGTDEIEMMRVARRAAWEWVRANPGRFVVRGLERFDATFGRAGGPLDWVGVEPIGADQGRIDHLSPVVRKALLTASNLCFGLLWGFTLWALNASLNRGPRLSPLTWAWTLACGIALLTIGAAAFVFEGQPRYHLPAIPLMMTAAAFLCEDLRARRGPGGEPARGEANP